jgi:hypothetical protein
MKSTIRAGYPTTLFLHCTAGQTADDALRPSPTGRAGGHCSAAILAVAVCGKAIRGTADQLPWPAVSAGRRPVAS